MFYFTSHHHATLCSASSRNTQNTLDVEVLKAPKQHLKEIMCWPLCKPCQKNANPSFQMDSKSHTHTHLCLKLSYSIILCFAWRQRLGSQIEVVPEVPSGRASAHVCRVDPARATGTGHAPMEQQKKHVWCHPITTQAAADSTHGKCVRVHAFKHTGRKENNSMFGQ